MQFSLLAPVSMLVASSPYLILKMQVLCSSQMSDDFQQIILHYISENCTFQNHHCVSLKPYKRIDVESKE
jgi:hypothetical protein